MLRYSILVNIRIGRFFLRSQIKPSDVTFFSRRAFMRLIKENTREARLLKPTTIFRQLL